MSGPTSLQSLLDVAVSVINTLAARRIVARLFGGLSIEVIAPWKDIFGIDRPVKDIDIIVPRSSMITAMDVLSIDGWKMNGRNQRINSGILVCAIDNTSGTRLDMYADPVILNQTLYFGQRLRILEKTLTPVDLLISKLQIVNITDRDLDDICALAGGCQVAAVDSPSTLNAERLKIICSNSWALQYTSIGNLDAAERRAGTHRDIQEERLARILQNVSLLRNICTDCPKSWTWRLRAKIGPLLPWYEQID